MNRNIEIKDINNKIINDKIKENNEWHNINKIKYVIKNE